MLRYFVCAILLFALATTSAFADDIDWRGDVLDLYPRVLTPGWHWNGGETWDNLAAPDPGDRAIFGGGYAISQGNLPNTWEEGATVYFGDFLAHDILGPDYYHAASNVEVGQLRVQNGDWLFDFSPYAVSNGASGSLSVQSLGYVGIGETRSHLGTPGNASLTVQNGPVTFGETAIGWGVGNVGELRLSDPNASLHVVAPAFADIYVGNGGEGRFLVENGAQATIDGTLLISRFDGDGHVVVSGNDTQVTGGLIVGATGHGDFLLQGGARFNATGGVGIGLGTDFYASRPGTVGIATVTGPGTELIADGRITVAGENDASGEFHILSSAHVESQSAFLASGEDTRAYVVMDADGSMAPPTWTVAQGVIVGERGAATLDLNYFSQLSSNYGIVGAGETSNGEVNIFGGSWTVAELLQVGESGYGTMNLSGFSEAFGQILPPAVLSTTDAWIGRNLGSLGGVVIHGDNATWNNANEMFVGMSGTGSLVVRGGARVSSSHGEIATTSLGVGTVTVVEPDSVLSLTDRLDVGISTGQAWLIGVAEGLVSVGHTLATGPNATVDVSGGGRVNVGQGDVGPLGGIIRIGDGGLLVGTGTLVGDLLVDGGGVVSPGFSPGTLHMHGNALFGVSSLLNLEIAGLDPAQYDSLDVWGDLGLHGIVKLSLIDGFQPHVGDTFDLFHVGGAFDASDAMLMFANGPRGLQFDTAFDMGTYSVRITQVPEPTSLALALLGMVALLSAARRRADGIPSR